MGNIGELADQAKGKDAIYALLINWNLYNSITPKVDTTYQKLNYIELQIIKELRSEYSYGINLDELLRILNKLGYEPSIINDDGKWAINTIDSREKISANDPELVGVELEEGEVYSKFVFVVSNLELFPTIDEAVKYTLKEIEAIYTYDFINS